MESSTNILSISTVPLYIPQTDFSVQVLAWPASAPIPSNATLNAVPSNLAGKPVAYDFNNKIWIDKSDDTLVALQKQVAALTAQALS